MRRRAPMLEITAKPQYPQTANTKEIGNVKTVPQFFSQRLAMAF